MRRYAAGLWGMMLQYISATRDGLIVWPKNDLVSVTGGYNQRISRRQQSSRECLVHVNNALRVQRVRNVSAAELWMQFSIKATRFLRGWWFLGVCIGVSRVCFVLAIVYLTSAFHIRCAARRRPCIHKYTCIHFVVYTRRVRCKWIVFIRNMWVSTCIVCGMRVGCTQNEYVVQSTKGVFLRGNWGRIWRSLCAQMRNWCLHYKLVQLITSYLVDAIVIDATTHVHRMVVLQFRSFIFTWISIKPHADDDRYEMRKPKHSPRNFFSEKSSTSFRPLDGSTRVVFRKSAACSNKTAPERRNTFAHSMNWNS